MSTIAAIAVGGALGAVSRHGVNSAALSLFGSDFPWGTMIVNFTGSFLVGLVVGVLGLIWQPSPEVKAFLLTGFLASFTTFSTFSLDMIYLWERGMALQSAGYIFGSVVLSLGGVLIALYLMRHIVS